MSLHQPGDERTIVNPVIRDTVRFLELSGETDGRHTTLQIDLAAGGGNERHYHRRYDETFTCVEGVLGLETAGTTRLLSPTESAVARAGEVHRFFNPSPDTPVRFIVRIEPGMPGFERMLQVAYGLARDGRTNAKGIPRNPRHTALIIHWSDTNLPGALSLLEPVLRRVARWAERDGTAQALINRYCRF